VARLQELQEHYRATGAGDGTELVPSHNIAPTKEEDNPDRWLWSATIITHHATWLAGVMNDRTPVILPPDRIDAWLDPQLTDKIAALKLISGIEYEPLQVRPVSTAVNKTGRGGSRGPELIEPIGEHADQPLQLVPA
jgi:putative SOS response-associated peptidase YedK